MIPWYKQDGEMSKIRQDRRDKVAQNLINSRKGLDKGRWKYGKHIVYANSRSEARARLKALGVKVEIREGLVRLGTDV